MSSVWSRSSTVLLTISFCFAFFGAGYAHDDGPKFFDQFPESGPPNVSNHRNLYLLPKDCGYFDADTRFMPGENAHLNEFPWMALLQYKGRENLFFNCGGTIINKNYILTAGHCLTGLSSELVSVRVGEHSIKNMTDCETMDKKTTCNPAVQDLKIEEVIPHPQFGTKPFMNDIGLIRVSTINLNLVNIRPVCLPTGNLQPYIFVLASGWGLKYSECKEKIDRLHKVLLAVADKEACIKICEGHNITVGNAQICAGGVNNQKYSCTLDGGGPIMVLEYDESFTAKRVQTGLLSFGPKYGTIIGYPDIYTSVQYYMDWILDNIKP